MVRCSLATPPLKWSRIWAPRTRPGEAPGRPVERVLWAVSTAWSRMPGAACLVAAFALQRLLAGEGHGSELHIGLAKREQRRAAHARLFREGRTLIGEHSDDYTHLLPWWVDGSSEPA